MACGSTKSVPGWASTPVKRVVATTRSARVSCMLLLIVLVVDWYWLLCKVGAQMLCCRYFLNVRSGPLDMRKRALFISLIQCTETDHTVYEHRCTFFKLLLSSPGSLASEDFPCGIRPY